MKHYPGTHSITLIVNGTERGRLDFEITALTEHNAAFNTYKFSCYNDRRKEMIP